MTPTTNHIINNGLQQGCIFRFEKNNRCQVPQKLYLDQKGKEQDGIGGP